VRAFSENGLKSVVVNVVGNTTFLEAPSRARKI